MTDDPSNKKSHDTAYFSSDPSAKKSESVKYQMAIDSIKEEEGVGRSLIIIGVIVFLIAIIFLSTGGFGAFLLSLPIIVLGIILVAIGMDRKISAFINMRRAKKHKLDKVKINNSSSGKSILKWVGVAIFATVALISLVFISMGPVPVVLFIISILIVVVILLHPQ